jgi:hypothetical protein
MVNKPLIAAEKQAHAENTQICAKQKARDKADRKALGALSEMEMKYLGKRVRAPLVDDSEVWVTGDVTGIDATSDTSFRLVVRGSNGVEVYCVQRKALLC